MRCPYCGGLNPEHSSFCIRCGREIAPQGTIAKRRAPQPPQPVQRPAVPQPQRPTIPQPKNPNPVVPLQAPPYQQPRPVSRPPASVPPSAQRATVVQPAQGLTAISPAPAAPQPAEAPVPFPPKTMEQLRALEPSALTYRLVGDAVNYSKKKIVRIAYQRCAAWQQVGTLIKALKEQDAAAFDTIVIQGVTERDADAYWYTNGQLVFDRNARLGSQTLKRYQIETGNGLSGDSVRIVLSE